MKTVNEDPILSVRKAVIDGMCRCGMEPSKRLVDAVVDSLPDFFRQPLQAAEQTDEDRGLKSFGESMANYQANNLRQ